MNILNERKQIPIYTRTIQIKHLLFYTNELLKATLTFERPHQSFYDDLTTPPNPTKYNHRNGPIQATIEIHKQILTLNEQEKPHEDQKIKEQIETWHKTKQPLHIIHKTEDGSLHAQNSHIEYIHMNTRSYDPTTDIEDLIGYTTQWRQSTPKTNLPGFSSTIQYPQGQYQKTPLYNENTNELQIHIQLTTPTIYTK